LVGREIRSGGRLGDGDAICAENYVPRDKNKAKKKKKEKEYKNVKYRKAKRVKSRTFE